MNRRRRATALLVGSAVVIAGLAPIACADSVQDAAREQQRLDQLQASKDAKASSASEPANAVAPSAEMMEQPSAPGTAPAAVLETLKKRAQRAIVKRRARRWMLATNTTLAVGIETNPNYDASRKGDAFFEEDTDLLFRWRWFNGLTQDVGHRLTNANYTELRDNNYMDNTLYTSWRYAPVRWLRITSGYEFNNLNYYENPLSSLYGHRVYVQVRHTLPKYLYYQAGWSWFYRGYSERMARDGDGNDTDKSRHDVRHTMHVELGSVIKGTYLSVRQEGAWHYSNDAYQDYYNYQSYRVRGTLARDFWTKWRGSGTFSFERKNYTDRLVSSDAVEAEYDNSFTYAASVTYNLSRDVSLQYSYTRRKQDSNAPLYEYTNTTNQFSLNASF